MRYRTALLAGGFLLAAFDFLTPSTATAGDLQDPEWPCVQRKVPTVSIGMVWAGPEVASDDLSWKDDPEISRLVPRLAARRRALEDAYIEIDRYAGGLGPNKNRKLTLLFVGLLQTIDRERREIMAGIERYARKQESLSKEIKANLAELSELRAVRTAAGASPKRLQALEEQLTWETRVYDERRQSLTYVCESPVLLEQRIFGLSRHIMSHLD
ncbi:MAG: hypothetical protein ACREDZ_13900 [Kiloniellales bacterium]